MCAQAGSFRNSWSMCNNAVSFSDRCSYGRFLRDWIFSFFFFWYWNNVNLKMRLPRKTKTAAMEGTTNTLVVNLSTVLADLAIENSSRWNYFCNFRSRSSDQTGRFGIALGSLFTRSPKVSTILHHIPFWSPVPILPLFVSFCVIALCYLNKKGTDFQETQFCIVHSKFFDTGQEFF